MSSPTARVTLRYRPAADVLSGLIDLGEIGATRTDTPDADTSMVWAPVTDGQFVGDHLVSFQLVFAAARLGEGPLPLPAALEPSVRSLIASARQAIEQVDHPLARLRALHETVIELDLATLARGALRHPPSAARTSDRQHAAQLSHSLSRAADAIRRTGSGRPLPDAIATDRLAGRLDELSSSIRHRHGRTAPGTTAAARVAAREVLGLSRQQRQALERAITAIDRPERWPTAERSLSNLLVALAPPAHTT